MSKSPRLRGTLRMLIDEIHTLNGLIAAQIADDPEARDSANHLARTVLHDTDLPHHGEDDIFEDGGA